MVKIAWCAGHGYNTPGKRTPDGEREWTFNDKFGRAFASELSKYENVELKRMDDPTGKTDVELSRRTSGANVWGANYYVSFHHNANTAKWGTWTGVETFVYTKNLTATSGKWAKAIQPALVSAYGLNDRGVKEGNLAIVRDTNCPAILIEGGFMDSTIDIKKLRDDNVLRNAGVQVAQATARFLGLKLKANVQPTVTIPVQQPKGDEELLNDTGRVSCKNMIKKGVKEGLFHDAHVNVEKYSDKELLSYALAYVDRKFK